jgi:hypothetical protein
MKRASCSKKFNHQQESAHTAGSFFEPLEKGEKKMKKLSVVVAGSGQIRDVQIESGTTAGDILTQLSLSDYLLSKGPNEPFFANAEGVYDKVNDGEKLFASTKAEVGVPACA